MNFKFTPLENQTSWDGDKYKSKSFLKGFTNKKVLIFVVIFVLLLVIGGVFLWLEKEKEEGIIVKFEPPENYIVKETPEGKIVENRKAGLSFRIPEGWNIKIYGNKGEEGVIEITSQDIESPPNRLPIKGCGVAVSVEYSPYEKETHSLANLIKEVQINKNIENNKDKEVIKIDSLFALKSMIFYKPEIGRGFRVQAPAKDGDKIYLFNTFFPSSDEERCSQEFNKFLETISINK